MHAKLGYPATQALHPSPYRTPPPLALIPVTPVPPYACDRLMAYQVSDKSELQRTLYFPGLGWLLSRKLFDEAREAFCCSFWFRFLCFFFLPILVILLNQRFYLSYLPPV